MRRGLFWIEVFGRRLWAGIWCFETVRVESGLRRFDWAIFVVSGTRIVDVLWIDAGLIQFL